MSLTCEHESDGDADWFYTQPEDFSILSIKRSRRCCSCGERIAVGSLVLKFYCNRPPKNEIEERIYGDDYEAVPMPTRYMCEPCGDLALNLKELGYCTPPGDDMRETVKEYSELVKFEQDALRGWNARRDGKSLPDDASDGFKSGWRKADWASTKAAA